MPGRVVVVEMKCNVLCGPQRNSLVLILFQVLQLAYLLLSSRDVPDMLICVDNLVLAV